MALREYLSRGNFQCPCGLSDDAPAATRLASQSAQAHSAVPGGGSRAMPPKRGIPPPVVPKAPMMLASVERAREKHTHTHTHIYIYIWPTPHFMGRYTPFFAFLPSFIVKNAPILQPTNCGCKFVFLFSSSSLLLPFFCLIFPFFPLLL